MSITNNYRIVWPKANLVVCTGWCFGFLSEVFIAFRVSNPKDSKDTEASWIGKGQRCLNVGSKVKMATSNALRLIHILETKKHWVRSQGWQRNVAIAASFTSGTHPGWVAGCLVNGESLVPLSWQRSRTSEKVYHLFPQERSLEGIHASLTHFTRQRGYHTVGIPLFGPENSLVLGTWTRQTFT